MPAENPLFEHKPRYFSTKFSRLFPKHRHRTKSLRVVLLVNFLPWGIWFAECIEFLLVLYIWMVFFVFHVPIWYRSFDVSAVDDHGDWTFLKKRIRLSVWLQIQMKFGKWKWTIISFFDAKRFSQWDAMVNDVTNDSLFKVAVNEAMDDHSVSKFNLLESQLSNIHFLFSKSVVIIYICFGILFVFQITVQLTAIQNYSMYF